MNKLTRYVFVATLSIVFLIVLAWWSFINMFNGPYEGGFVGIVELLALVALFVLGVGYTWRNKREVNHE